MFKQHAPNDKNEFQIVIDEYQKFVQEYYEHKMLPEHFILKDLLIKLRNDYELFNESKTNLDHLFEDQQISQDNQE